MGFVVTATALLVVAGCGRIGFAPEPDAAVSHDVLDEGVLGQPFGPVMPLTPLHGPDDDDDPSMTEDGLELYFCSNRIGMEDHIFRSVRASLDDPWPAPTEVAVLGTPANNARVSLDGLAIYFSGARVAGDSVDIFRATRPSRDVEFGPPVRVDELVTVMRDYEPAVASTTSAIFFTSDRAGDQDLYVALRLGNGMFGEATRIVELATAEYEGGTWATADGLRLWYHTVQPASGLRMLVQTQRASTAAPFDPPVPIPGLASPNDDQDPWISPDGRTIVFASDRGGTPDLYFATR